GEDVNIDLLARQTPGFAGADLENLVNEAALLAARKNKDRVSMSDFEIAKDKVMMGAERRSMIISVEERRVIAYHESGHALVAKLVPNADPVHKVTIILRRDLSQKLSHSEQSAIQSNAEGRRILLEAYERAKLFLRRNLEVLHKMAETLLERESIDGAEIDEILRQFGTENGGLRGAAA